MSTDSRLDTSKVATSNRTDAATASKPGPAGSLASWADDRLGLATAMKKNLRKVFPDHWSFMLGEIALWSFVVLLLTGVFLTLWFNPSMGHVTYEGSTTSSAASECRSRWHPRCNLVRRARRPLMRQMHHWAAIVFIASMMVHLLRVAFTGAYRKPASSTGSSADPALLGTLEGFTGYSLPDDLLSGTGVRAADGFLKATPVAGSYMSFLLFGGEFPGQSIIPRLYIVHVLLIPGILLALVAAQCCCSSTTSTPSGPVPAAPSRTSSATRCCRCTPPRPVASSSWSSVSLPSWAV